MGIAEFALGIIGNLIAAAIQGGVTYPAGSYFVRRRIERRVEDATAEAVEPLLPFLANERIPEKKQRRLIQTCVDELTPFTKKPEMLFQSSLDGQKIFDELYADHDLPEVIIEDGLKEIYSLLFPRIATLLCKIPAAVKDWESQAWTENFKRLDEITKQMRSVFLKVDELATETSRKSDETLSLIRRTLAQKVEFELDLTGLRSDRPVLGKFDDFFVHPEIAYISDDRDPNNIIRVSGPEESVQHFVKKNEFSVILGSPGAGKSTWAKWLQRRILTRQNEGIAIRKELRNISDENTPSIYELVREAAGRHLAEELTAERIGTWLETTQIVFILDGFDEIRPAARDFVFQWIIDLKTASRGSPLIVTSRPLTTNHILYLTEGENPWSILPFDKNRIVDYIGRWYKNTPLIPDGQRQIDAEQLAQSWLNDPTISHLTGNPLLLSTLLMVHHLDGSLPHGRSQLYRRYVEGMLGIWDNRRQISATSIDLTLEQKTQILRSFALHLFLMQQEQLDEVVVLEWLGNLLHKMNINLDREEVLNALRERTGLIIGPGIYGFSHKSIIEYFVADAALQGDQRDLAGNRIDRFMLFEHRDDDRWNTVIFLWAGLAPIADLESFIEEAIKWNNLPLAIGLLQDQFDKIPVDIKRKLLNRILGLNLPLRIDEFSAFWIVSGAEASIGDLYDTLQVPSFELRGLTLRSDFSDLIFRATESNLITWQDFANAKGSLRDLLWMAFAEKRNDIATWKSCLAETCPNEVKRAAWLYWVAERAIIDCFVNDESLPLPEVMDAFLEVHVSLQDMLPIALMSGFVNAAIISDTLIPSKIPQIVSMLMKYKSINPELLLSTSKWNLGWGSDRKSVDLLDSFMFSAEKFVTAEIITDDKSFQNVRQIVEEYKRQRKAKKSRGL